VLKCLSVEVTNLIDLNTSTLLHFNTNKMPSTYFDLPTKLSQYEKASVAILPVPLDITTSYVKGTRLAPKAILTASAQVELYDEELEGETCDIGIATLPAIKTGKKPFESIAEEIGRTIGRIVRDGKLPVMIGG